MTESLQSCFELSIHFPVFFSRELFLVAGSLYRQMHGKFKTRLAALLSQLHPIRASLIHDWPLQ